MSIKQRCGLAFGLMLTFLQLLLVAADDQVVCTTQPPALPHNDLYNQHCPFSSGDTSTSFWPCFAHASGDLYQADISADLNNPKYDNDNILLVRDSDLAEFTPKDLARAFSIDYHQAGIRFEYAPITGGCVVLNLIKYNANSGYRMFITSGKDDASSIEVDTSENSGNETTCSKMYFIHLVKEGN
ncbi:related to Mig1 protein [Sporisorium scitamineum]|uniref:Related to Mig1 protein n=1 Tax=Sporisorium scitamineum TaxID=49012 RepID=A0A0F7RUQ0_9BASI|nr:related to Mig1 protein [Sporisorium scitamineum]CDS00225.1 hypothetical protein [Sporisorium scitamineum]